MTSSRRTSMTIRPARGNVNGRDHGPSKNRNGVAEDYLARVGEALRNSLTNQEEGASWLCKSWNHILIPVQSHLAYKTCCTDPEHAVLLVRYDIVPNAATALQLTIRSLRSICSEKQATEGAPPGPPEREGAQDFDASHLSETRRRFMALVDVLVFVVGWAARSAEALEERAAARGRAPTPPGVLAAVRSLLTQLQSPAVLKVLAEALDWMADTAERESSTTTHGSAATMSPVASAEAGVEREAAVDETGPSRRRLQRQASTGGGDVAAFQQASNRDSTLNSCLAWAWDAHMQASSILDALLADQRLDDHEAVGSGELVRLLSFLRDMHSSGFLGSLCDSLVRLESVMGRGVAACGSAPVAALVRPSSCSQVFKAVQLLSLSIRVYRDKRAIVGELIKLLRAPGVRRLRFAAMEQLAASAAAVVPVYGPGGEKGPALWPVLHPALHAQMPRTEDEPGLTHTQVHEAFMDVFFAPASSIVTWFAMDNQHMGNDLPMRLWAAELPPVPVLVPLVAGCCRAIAAGLRADGGVDRAGGSANSSSASSRAGGSAAAAGGSGRPPTEAMRSRKMVAAEAAQLAVVSLRISGALGGPPAFDAYAADLAEATAWALQGLAAVQTQGGVSLDRHSVTTAVVAMRELAGRYSSSSPELQHAIVQRLLPTRLLNSLDSLIRHELTFLRSSSPWSKDPLPTHSVFLAGEATRLCLPGPQPQHRGQPPLDRQQAAPSGSGGSASSSLPVPQDDLGIYITLAKLARLEMAAAQGVLQAAAPAAADRKNGALMRSFDDGVHELAQAASTACRSGYKLLSSLPPCTQGRDTASSASAAETSAQAVGECGPADPSSSVRYSAALREAVALTANAAVPLFEALLLSNDVSAKSRQAQSRAGPQNGLADLADKVPDNVLGLADTLIAAVAVQSPAETLALKPQRLLALMAQRLQRGADARASKRQEQQRPGRPGMRGAWDLDGRAIAAAMQEAAISGRWVRAAAQASLSLTFLAAHEGLAEQVADWLRHDSGEAGQQLQGREEEEAEGEKTKRLDVDAFMAALLSWNDRSAAAVVKLRDAARSLSDTRAPTATDQTCGCAPSGNGSRSSGDRAVGSGDIAPSDRVTSPGIRSWAAPLVTTAREILGSIPEEGHYLALAFGAGRGAAGDGSSGEEGQGSSGALPPSQPPLWPPRELRLCGNLRCANFSGPAEAALKLKRCAGCKVVRYCGAECQRQDWQEGGHRRLCVKIKEAGAGALQDAGS